MISLPITDPTLIFFVVLLIILLSPIIMGKLRIPHIIGMVLAGVLVGPWGLNLLSRDNSFELFGKVGLYYIMFLASLEMDMNGVRNNWRKILIFGLLTFCIPFILTVAMGKNLLGYTEFASILLACIMSSNTLIAYPIVMRYGLQRKPSVMLSVGSTIVSLFVALVVLASITESYSGNGGVTFWLMFTAKFFLFCIGIIFFIPRLTRWFIRRYSDAVMQFIFVLAVMFFCAALSEMIGLEGIFGAFFAGLIMNRYIPRVSPLMNRLEFIGNAIFIPYFLIGVGMLINIRLLFEGSNILWTVVLIVLFGTAGKAIAAYLSCLFFRMPTSSGNMMFGLTSAHAAGAIAMIMVGMRVKDSSGNALISDEILNGVVIMILITCIISSIVTEAAAQQITIRDQEIPDEDDSGYKEDKILVPIKYPEYANRLVSLATMMMNPKMRQSLIGLNIVYDDTHMLQNQEKGRRLLEKATKFAAASDVRMETQLRVAANIANGIKHAFKEFRASEIIIGMHMHKSVSNKFWGEFHQSLFNGLNNQIIMASLMQPLNTLRRITVAVPSRAQFEPGFYRWLERICCLVKNLECKIGFHGRSDTLELIRRYVEQRYRDIRASYNEMEHWNEMPELAGKVAYDHMFVIVTARKGTVSFKNALDRLPEEVIKYFNGRNYMIVFPDQHGEAMDEMTFAQSQHMEEKSAYEAIRDIVTNRIFHRFK
jgi:Kef-type K+ transport system membrane component KefB